MKFLVKTTRGILPTIVEADDYADAMNMVCDVNFLRSNKLDETFHLMSFFLIEYTGQKLIISDGE